MNNQRNGMTGAVIRRAMLLIFLVAGGNGALPAQTLSPLGCFKDQGDPQGTSGRDLSRFITSAPDMTGAQCVSLCRARGFPYAGTQYGSYCFCGDSYGNSGPAANCDMPCSGNPSEKCGGAWANTVYAAIPPRPDLVIARAVLNPRSPTPFDSVALHVDVRNQGTADATLTVTATGQRHFNIQVWDTSGRPVKGWTLEPAVLPVTIPMGATVTLSIPTVSVLTDVVGDFLWDIELYSFVTELNAGNNALRIPVTVRPRPAAVADAPDLRASCRIAPGEAKSGERVVLHANLRNDGAGDAVFPAQASLLRWRSAPAGGGGALDYGFSAPSSMAPIKPGEVRAFSFDLARPDLIVKPGKYQLTITADSGNRVAETNEANNDGECAFSVLGEAAPIEEKR